MEKDKVVSTPRFDVSTRAGKTKEFKGHWKIFIDSVFQIFERCAGEVIVRSRSFARLNSIDKNFDFNAQNKIYCGCHDKNFGEPTVSVGAPQDSPQYTEMPENKKANETLKKKNGLLSRFAFLTKKVQDFEMCTVLKESFSSFGFNSTYGQTGVTFSAKPKT